MLLRQNNSLPLSAVLLLALSACGGDDDGVDVVGDTPQEAAEEITNATCDKLVECGTWNLDLEFDDQGNVTSCTPTHMDVDKDACVAEDLSDVQEELECAMPTDDEAEMINACINDLLDQDCISEEEVNAICDALENGEEPEEPAVPASCDAIEAIFEGCGGDDGGV
jgi:hypothetical protein